MIATARVQPAEAPRILTGKQPTSKPSDQARAAGLGISAPGMDEGRIPIPPVAAARPHAALARPVSWPGKIDAACPPALTCINLPDYGCVCNQEAILITHTERDCATALNPDDRRGTVAERNTGRSEADGGNFFALVSWLFGRLQDVHGNTADIVGFVTDSAAARPSVSRRMQSGDRGESRARSDSGSLVA